MMKDIKTLEAFTLDTALTPLNGMQGYVTWAEKSKKNMYQERLLLVDSGTTLYICGHSHAGSKTISSPDDKVEVRADTLAEYLQALPQDWSGRIKCFGCETASSTQFWIFQSQSFAKRLLDMLQKTHQKLTVYGYTHKIANWPTADPKTGQMHKYIDGVRVS